MSDDAERLAYRWRHSQLFLNYEHQHYDPERGNAEVWETVQTYIKGMRKTTRGLLLSGPQGTGKTLLAHEVCRAVFAKEIGYLRAVSFADYMDKIAKRMTLAESVGVNAETYAAWNEVQEQLEEYRTIRWLLLDDIGTEHQTNSDWAKNQLASLLRARANQARPTIITTNYQAADLEGAYGRPTASLLEEMVIVAVPGRDWRRRT